MRFIDGVEVVEPKELRDEVRAIVKQAAARL
jgi:predicted DNA-binding transcriptional regulator YafY